METKAEQKPRDPADTTPAALLDRIGAMERALADQGDRLRDHEKSLVERIADVDDDRRTTAAKLQRAWQSQRDEIDGRLRRQTWTLAGALVLLALAVGSALFLIYRQATLDRQSLARAPEELKAEPARMTPGAPTEAQPEDTLTRLSAAVEETASSLARLKEAQRQALQDALAGERASRTEGEARLAAELRRLATEQQGLAEALGSLRAPIAGEGAGGEEVGAQLASEIRSLATEQQHLAEGLESLRQTQTPPAASAAEGPAQTASAGDDAGSVDPARSGESTYALQLIGFRSRDAMLKFAERADLPAKLYFRADSIRGRPWFALIHSLHDDYASAEAELSRLPEELVRLDPWIRPIRDRGDLKPLDQAAPR